MNTDTLTKQITQFGADVSAGLSAYPKTLSSKYFYDAKGDALFQQIMHLDEYYLTRAELEIFETQKQQLLEQIQPNGGFRLIELGAGDGLKTKVLLKYFLEQGVNFSYSPVDISANVLRVLEENLLKDIPELSINPLVGDYFQVLEDMKIKSRKRNVVFFLGSNIGNFLNETAENFLKSIHNSLKKGDILMLGFDLKKDPARILKAYNDASGVTRAFNLNLLDRINSELGGNFNTNNFQHNPVYDPMTGECRSYLLSKVDQEVYIEELDKTFSFEKWEPIFVEVSKKYSIGEIDHLARATGFTVVENMFDSQRLFTDSIWEVR